MRFFALDEARFGLKVWHRRRWCPRSYRPPWQVEDRYEWVWLYAAVEPVSGESFCFYMPGVNGRCFELFLAQLRKAYPTERIVLVVDGAPAHRSGKVEWPKGMEKLELPRYSPELDPVERWFKELRDRLSNSVFATLEELEEALTHELRPYWEEPLRLARLAGYGWWLEAFNPIPTS